MVNASEEWMQVQELQAFLDLLWELVSVQLGQYVGQEYFTDFLGGEVLEGLVCRCPFLPG